MKFVFEGNRAEMVFANVCYYVSKHSKECEDVIKTHNQNVSALQKQVDQWVDEHKDDDSWYFPSFRFNPDITTKLTLYELAGIKKLIGKLFKVQQLSVEGKTGEGKLIDLDDAFIKPAKSITRVVVKYDVSRGEMYKMNKSLKRKITITFDGDIKERQRIIKWFGLDISEAKKKRLLN